MCATGWCLCTFSAIRAGFSIIWGTEICPKHPESDGCCDSECTDNRQQRMWLDLTGGGSILQREVSVLKKGIQHTAVCLGNTFTDTAKYNHVQDPDYLTSGQPCPNYSISGNKLGAQGDTGWMFVAQTDIILLKLSLILI